MPERRGDDLRQNLWYPIPFGLEFPVLFVYNPGIGAAGPTRRARTVNVRKGETEMDEKKAENLKGAKQISDDEAGKAAGGMKIVVSNHQGWLRSILRLIFKIKGDED